MRVRLARCEAQKLGRVSVMATEAEIQRWKWERDWMLEEHDEPEPEPEVERWREYRKEGE